MKLRLFYVCLMSLIMVHSVRASHDQRQEVIEILGHLQESMHKINEYYVPLVRFAKDKTPYFPIEKLNKQLLPTMCVTYLTHYFQLINPKGEWIEGDSAPISALIAQKLAPLCCENQQLKEENCKLKQSIHEVNKVLSDSSAALDPDKPEAATGAKLNELKEAIVDLYKHVNRQFQKLGIVQEEQQPVQQSTLTDTLQEIDHKMQKLGEAYKQEKANNLVLKENLARLERRSRYYLRVINDDVYSSAELRIKNQKLEKKVQQLENANALFMGQAGASSTCPHCQASLKN